MIRYTIHFSGHVQGVGFRYTAHSVARAHAVAGYVQNLPDRRVLLVIEGEPADLDGYLTDLQERMRDYIHQTQKVSSQATGEYGTPAPGRLGIRH